MEQSACACPDLSHSHWMKELPVDLRGPQESAGRWSELSEILTRQPKLYVLFTELRLEKLPKGCQVAYFKRI